jgi:hypothetical protein
LDHHEETAMPITRTLETKILPGRRSQWGAAMRDVKTIVDKHGAALRLLQLQLGGHPATALAVSEADSWETLATRIARVNADPEYQAYLARAADLPGFPYAEPVEVRVSNDITSEVGGARVSLQEAQIIQVTSLRVLPGRRAKQLELITQLREARSGVGLPTANLLEVVAGQANVLLIVRGYRDLAAWAQDRAAGQPEGQKEIVQRAQADPQYPFADGIATRVFSDITNQL